MLSVAPSRSTEFLRRKFFNYSGGLFHGRRAPAEYAKICLCAVFNQFLFLVVEEYFFYVQFFPDALFHFQKDFLFFGIPCHQFHCPEGLACFEIELVAKAPAHGYRFLYGSHLELERFVPEFFVVHGIVGKMDRFSVAFHVEVSPDRFGDKGDNRRRDQSELLESAVKVS